MLSTLECRTRFCQGRPFRSGHGRSGPLPCDCNLVTRCDYHWLAHLDQSWVWHPPTPAAAPHAPCLFILSLSSSVWHVFLPLASVPKSNDNRFSLHFASVSCSGIMRVSESLATKLLEKEFAASVKLEVL